MYIFIYIYCMHLLFVLCYLPKLKRAMALAFSAGFLYVFHRNVPY